MPPSIQLRSFVVGCPRSGTTLLQSFLAAHPDVASFPESGFFTDLFGRQDWRMHGRRHASAWREWRGEWALRLGLAHRRSAWAHHRLTKFLENTGRVDLLKGIPEEARRASVLGRRFITVLDRMALDAGKHAWLEKTPSNLNYIDCILRILPSARFVNILRDGADSVASLHDMGRRFPDKWWKQFLDIDLCIAMWNRSVQSTRRFRHHPAHMLVRYDDLVTSTEAVLRDICRFLGLEYSTHMIENRGQANRPLVMSKEPWKAEASQPLTLHKGEKFERLFDAEQQKHIQSRLERLD